MSDSYQILSRLSKTRHSPNGDPKQNPADYVELCGIMATSGGHEWFQRRRRVSARVVRMGIGTQPK